MFTEQADGIYSKYFIYHKYVFKTYFNFKDIFYLNKNKNKNNNNLIYFFNSYFILIENSPTYFYSYH